MVSQDTGTFDSIDTRSAEVGTIAQSPGRCMPPENGYPQPPIFRRITVFANDCSAALRILVLGLVLGLAVEAAAVRAQGDVRWGAAGEPIVACTGVAGTTGPVTMVDDGVTVTTTWSESPTGLDGAGSGLTDAGCAVPANNFVTDAIRTIGGGTNTFVMGMDATIDDSSQYMEVVLTFSPPLINATFRMLDVDFQTNAWTDVVLVEARDNASAFVFPTAVVLGQVPPDAEPTTVTTTTSTTVCPGYLITENRCFVGITENNFPNDDSNGNLVLTYGSGDLASIRVRYMAGDDSVDSDPSGQWLGFGLVSWTSNMPVVITAVESEAGQGETRLSWTTASETANAGFRVLARDGASWTPVATMPSRDPNARLAQDYEVVIPGEHRELMIEDLDLLSRPHRNGPYLVGRSYGAEPRGPKAIDWVGIKQSTGLVAPLDRVRQAAAVQPSRASRWPSSPDAKSTGSSSVVREARLLVAKPGIQIVTHEALLAAGVDLGGIRAKEIAVVDEGKAVPRRVGGADAFGAGSFIEFLAVPARSLWSPVDIYTLVVDAKLAKAPKVDKVAKSAAAAAIAGRYTHRVDAAYGFVSPLEDPFFEAGLLGRPGAPARLSRVFDLADFAVSGDAVLRVEAWGSTAFASPNDHHVRVFLNGAQVGDHLFDGIAAFSASYDVSGLLGSTSNLFEVEVVGDGGNPWDLVNFEAFEVDYRRRSEARSGVFAGATKSDAYLVEGFSGGEVVGWLGGRRDPSRLELGRSRAVAVPKDSKGVPVWLAERGRENTPGIEAGVPRPLTHSRAEYVIVAHPSLSDSTSGLVALQKSRGLTAEVVTTDQIYAAYSDYQETPEAIFRFLERSARTGKLRYVALVGGASYDPYDHLGLGSLSLVPTAYVEVGLVRFTPSDEPMVDFDGDGFPDVPIGRLPARTPAELEAVIAKQWAWSPTPEAVLTSGDFGGSGILATANDRYADGLAGWKAQQSDVDRIGRDAVRSGILEAFGPNGPAIVSFTGHSSFGIWDFSPLLHWSDVGSFSNSRRPSLVVQWGCWNAYFPAPDIEDMSTHLLLEPTVGAVAVIGATTLTRESSHRALGERFFLEVGAGAGTIGEAFLRAKRSLAKVGAPLDAVYGMVLLGDPALPLPPRQVEPPPVSLPPPPTGGETAADSD